MTDLTRIPVLIGAGQHTSRETDPLAAPDPFTLMELAACRAAESAVGEGRAGDLLSAVTHCYMVHSLSLRHGDPARVLADRLGASGAEARCSGMGGNIPQWILDRGAEQILAGERPVILVAGAEALATRKRAKRQGVKLQWPGDGGWPETWPPLEPDLGVHPGERAAGLDQATAMYALVETALAHAAGHDTAAHQQSVGALMARFNEVAAANPYSWFPTARSAHEIITVTADNRVIFHPYPKYVNAVMDVDMGAAVLLTDAESARQWGLGSDDVVYLRGWADAHDIWYLSQRPEVHRSPALAQCAATALDMAGVGLAEVGAFDLYSCFPSSVEAALDALGIDQADPRPLTLTGGLPYHGGPGSNYVTHCVANAFAWLRAGGSEHALVHGNGYYLTKHTVGLYSRQAPDEVPVPADKLQDSLDAASSPVPVEMTLPGQAIVLAYTVGFDRNGDIGQGVVLVEESGRRAVAVADVALSQALVAADGVGSPVVLQASGDGPDTARVP